MLRNILSISIHSLEFWVTVLNDESHPYYGFLEDQTTLYFYGRFWESLAIVAGCDILGGLSVAGFGVIDPTSVAVGAGVASGLAVIGLLFG